MCKRGQVSACPSVRAVGHPLTRRSELVNPRILQVLTTHQVRRERGEVQTRQGARGGSRTREDSGEVREDRAPRGVSQGDCVSVVRSQKKEREAPESSVKVREAEADAVPESAASPVPESANALAPRAAASQAPSAAVPMPGSGGKHRVRQAAKAALGGVGTPTLLTRVVVGTKDVGARTKTPTTLTLRVPLTELLRRGDVPRTLLLLLALTTTRAAPLRGTTSTSSTPSATAASTSATTAASAPTAAAATTSASAAATTTTTPATTPTATPTPSAASTATSTAPASSTRALAPLALARSASPARGRRRAD
ncbi:unnamed protein product [Closterium sp. NIES-65]|nr:unnamed protein product [Closterium sp. NIES-65]